MKLTTEIVKKYEGGQLEIQNQNEGYLFRGEIEKAWVEGDSLHVKFKWLAKMGEDGKWYSDQKLDYSIGLELASVSDVGDGSIFYRVAIIREAGTFFPPDGSKLDPNKVIGLQAVS